MAKTSTEEHLLAYYSTLLINGGVLPVTQYDAQLAVSRCEWKKTKAIENKQLQINTAEWFPLLRTAASLL